MYRRISIASVVICTLLIFVEGITASRAQSHVDEPDSLVLAFGNTDTNYDSLLDAYLAFDSLLLSQLDADSVSFLGLLDSLAAMTLGVSYLTVRSGYSSNILNAGRDYGFNQFGFSGGASYTHKSGLYLDLMGYWNSDLTPKYNLTTTSIGYLRMLSPKWSLITSYDRLFYHLPNDSEESLAPAFRNILNLSTYFDLTHVSAGADYAFLFGDEKAHRIRPSVSGVIRARKVGPIDAITIMPGLSVLWGNQNILTENINYTIVEEIIAEIGERRFLFLYRNYPEIIASYLLEIAGENHFGLMNTSISLPVYFYVGNLSALVSYSLNFPHALPGEEDLDLKSNSFYGVTLTYSFFFR